jgi:hypothetical protein
MVTFTALFAVVAGQGITGNVYAASRAGTEAAYAFILRYFPVISGDNCPGRSCACGRAGSVELEAPVGSGFSIEFVNAANDSRPSVTELSVEQLEDLFTVGNITDSLWMDYSTAVFVSSLDQYITVFQRDAVEYSVLVWRSGLTRYYSLIVRIPGTLGIFEIVSARQKVLARKDMLAVDERFRFRVELPDGRAPDVPEGRMQPLQVSRATTNVQRIIRFYKTVFDIDPVDLRVRDKHPVVKFRLGGGSVLLQFVERPRSP